MGKYLLKPKKDVDFYLDWSTFVDDAIAWGDREFMLRQGYSEERLTKCDQVGTSALWFRRSWLGESGRGGEIWRQQGWLRYSQMEDFFNAIAELYPDDAKIPEDLLELHPELKAYLDPLEN